VMQSPRRDACQFGELFDCEHGFNINPDVMLMSRTFHVTARRSCSLPKQSLLNRLFTTEVTKITEKTLKKTLWTPCSPLAPPARAGVWLMLFSCINLDLRNALYSLGELTNDILTEMADSPLLVLKLETKSLNDPLFWKNNK
jgi:hypothetical protein